MTFKASPVEGVCQRDRSALGCAWTLRSRTQEPLYASVQRSYSSWIFLLRSEIGCAWMPPPLLPGDPDGPFGDDIEKKQREDGFDFQ